MSKPNKEIIGSPNAPKALGPYSAGIKTESFSFYPANRFWTR
jgi:hypothetical protein